MRNLEVDLSQRAPLLDQIMDLTDRLVTQYNETGWPVDAGTIESPRWFGRTKTVNATRVEPDNNFSLILGEDRKIYSIFIPGIGWGIWKAQVEKYSIEDLRRILQLLKNLEHASSEQPHREVS